MSDSLVPSEVMCMMQMVSLLALGDQVGPKRLIHTHTHTHTLYIDRYRYIYIYIDIRICICMCICINQ
jgi:hypothetical protein